MDRTVRLWHVSRGECLCTFKHSDIVPCIQFHPRDDRFFLAGSLDSKLRLWSIPDKSVAFWNQLPEMITAVAFTPDGKTCIAGCLTGLCVFYDTEGLKYQTQIMVKSNHGKNAKGSKITGIQTCILPKGDPNGEVKLLVSSNDSRIRLYNFRDKSLEMKFKGHENNYSQIRATCSEDTSYVICGSEDRKVYIWSSSPLENDKKDKRPVEMFEAHTTITTCAILAPTKTRQFLGNSEDPIYDICNPPPVTLLSREESVYSSKPPTENGSVQVPGAAADAALKKAESPAFIARSAHTGGQIIVTADYTGTIKVFRQDCAFGKRRTDSVETSSLISKRVNSTFGGRNTSVSTYKSGRLRHDSISTQPPSDRILSWRQSIQSSASLDQGSSRNSHKGRSISPRKSLTQLSVASSRARFDSSLPAHVPSDVFGSAGTTSPAVSLNRSSVDDPISGRKNRPAASAEAGTSNPLWIQGDQSYLFWNKQSWKDRSQQQPQQQNQLEAPTSRSKRASVASIVSSEESVLTDADGDGDAEGANDTIRCKRCGSTSFKAKMSKSDAHSLVCTRCGTPAS